MLKHSLLNLRKFAQKCVWHHYHPLNFLLNFRRLIYAWFYTMAKSNAIICRACNFLSEIRALIFFILSSVRLIMGGEEKRFNALYFLQHYVLFLWYSPVNLFVTTIYKMFDFSSHSLLKNFDPSESDFLDKNLKQTRPNLQGVEKLNQWLLYFLVFHFVWGFDVPLERCEILSKQSQKRGKCQLICKIKAIDEMFRNGVQVYQPNVVNLQ